MTSDSLPFVQGEAYMASWDSPLSEKRLLKLSYLLANLIKKGQKIRNPSTTGKNFNGPSITSMGLSDSSLASSVSSIMNCERPSISARDSRSFTGS